MTISQTTFANYSIKIEQKTTHHKGLDAYYLIITIIPDLNKKNRITTITSTDYNLVFNDMLEKIKSEFFKISGVKYE
ncbi:MAG: hypothetical protein RSD51_03375 [Malacoplasma sp.]